MLVVSSLNENVTQGHTSLIYAPESGASCRKSYATALIDWVRSATFFSWVPAAHESWTKRWTVVFRHAGLSALSKCSEGDAIVAAMRRPPLAGFCNQVSVVVISQVLLLHTISDTSGKAASRNLMKLSLSSVKEFAGKSLDADMLPLPLAVACVKLKRW